MTIREKLYGKYVERDHGHVSLCWDWSGAIQTGGYGTIWFSGRQYLAHRMSAELSIGTQPEGKPYCCHKCGNRVCINPDHLYWGTAKENTADCIKSLGGWWRPSAKISLNQRDEIRTMYSSGNYTQVRLGKMFGVTKFAICRIVKSQQT